MNTTAAPAPGFLASLRSLGDRLAAGAQERLELFSVELQEEGYRLVRTLVWVGAAVFTAMLALVFASLALVYVFWADARLAVLGGLAAFYAAACTAILLALRRHLARRPRPFAATLSTLAEDRACIRNGT